MHLRPPRPASEASLGGHRCFLPFKINPDIFVQCLLKFAVFFMELVEAVEAGEAGEVAEVAEVAEVGEVKVLFLIFSHSEQLLLSKVLSILSLNGCFAIDFSPPLSSERVFLDLLASPQVKKSRTSKIK